MVALPIRGKNSEYRSREYLTADEVGALIDMAYARGRHKQRDYTLLLLMYRHGLRASEAATLRWDAVMLGDRRITINRAKNSKSGDHPLQQDEIEALEEMKAAYPESSQYVFPSERGGHISPYAIAKIIERVGQLAELPFKCHPHMLRHSCGYHLANQGLDTRLIQEWLGHRDIKNTERYTALNLKRFRNIEW